MSAATDKARFFLEQSVPELKDYERKKIFNKVSPLLSGSPWVEDGFANRETTRMKLPRSSRNGRISSTNSMRVARSLSILCDMSNMR